MQRQQIVHSNAFSIPWILRRIISPKIEIAISVVYSMKLHLVVVFYTK